jgi:hypothetical protein
MHTKLVLSGDFNAAEALLADFASSGLFGSYIKSSAPLAVWKELTSTLSSDGDAPDPRGGHAMCIDSETGVIYLHGGYNGSKSLDDLWSFDIAQGRWNLLSHSTSGDKNGPSPRSCHKIVFDERAGCLYLLGGLEDRHQIAGADAHDAVTHTSEFYRYRTKGIDAGKWDYLTFDTAVSMCF